MVGGELGRRDASATAVWPDLFVVAPPVGNDLAGLRQRGEPVLVGGVIPPFLAVARSGAKRSSPVDQTFAC